MNQGEDQRQIGSPSPLDRAPLHSPPAQAGGRIREVEDQWKDLGVSRLPQRTVKGLDSGVVAVERNHVAGARVDGGLTGTVECPSTLAMGAV
jgi:hypothetical protein